MIQNTLMNIGGTDLAPTEVAMLLHILDNPNLSFLPEDEPAAEHRQALDMLVLEGIIERFRAADETWLNGWVLTDTAVTWAQEAEVQADLELAKSLFD
jgi:hypothetical protein